MWKTISILGNDYLISNLGEVKSKGRWVEYVQRNQFDVEGTLVRRWIEERILKTHMHGDMERVSIFKKSYYVKNLVLAAFIDERLLYTNPILIKNKDGNKYNNALDNLIVVSDY